MTHHIWTIYVPFPAGCSDFKGLRKDNSVRSSLVYCSRSLGKARLQTDAWLCWAAQFIVWGYVRKPTMAKRDHVYWVPGRELPRPTIVEEGVCVWAKMATCNQIGLVSIRVYFITPLPFFFFFEKFVTYTQTSQFRMLLDTVAVNLFTLKPLMSGQGCPNLPWTSFNDQNKITERKLAWSST